MKEHNQEKTEVTVLMPAYNAEKYIKEAIISVLNQTFGNFEFLIVNDGSTDKTEEVIRSFTDPRIVLINQANGGVSAALNSGLEIAKGRYIARFDADDICYPHRLQEQYQFMQEHPEYVLIGSDANYVDKNGEFLFYYKNIAHLHDEICAKISFYCPFVHSTVFYVTSVAKQLGGYDVKAHTFEDYLLWIRFVKQGKVCNFTSPLIDVRLNPESVTVDDKLRGKRFTDLKKQILFGNTPITDAQEQELMGILRSQNFTNFKNYSYYILVAKKFLWNNHQPQRARKNLKKAIAINPFSTAAYKLLAISFLPSNVLSGLYRNLKAQP
jgi:glycosyltransferase involved in cell wall biosynthesis